MAKLEIKGKTLLIALIVLVALALVYFNRDQLLGTNKSTNTLAGKNYSAVFLTNGQVYFGRLKNTTSQYVELTDIYYLQVSNQSLQPDQQKDKDKKAKLELVKLGNELHGPKDEMHINRDHILFWEELKPDGQVMQTIKKQKESAQNK